MSTPKPANRHRLVFAVLTVVLIAMHLAAGGHPPPEDPVRLWLGFIPDDMAFHLLWMVFGTALVVYLCAKVWPDRE